MKNRVLSLEQLANLKKAAEIGSDCEVSIPPLTYSDILRGGGIEVELEEQFETLGDLSLTGYALFTKYFPRHANRFANA